MPSDMKLPQHWAADMLNIETLLIEKFLGFYDDKPLDIKNYIYIAWALWAQGFTATV